MHLDSTVTGLLIFAAVYLVLAWAGFRWARWRVNRVARNAAATLQAAGARLVAQRPTTSLWRAAEADFELDGKAATLVVRQWGRDSQTIGVRIAASPMPTIWLRRERGFDKVGKALALEREVQLGVKDFDDAVFIASAAPDDVVRRALGGAELQRLVREIVDRKYSVLMSHDGLQATTLRNFWRAPFDGESLPAVLELLRNLGAALPALEPAVTARGRMPLPSIAVIAPAYLCIFLPMLVLAPGLRDVVRPPMDASHVVIGLGLGLLLGPARSTSCRAGCVAGRSRCSRCSRWASRSSRRCRSSARSCSSPSTRASTAGRRRCITRASWATTSTMRTRSTCPRGPAPRTIARRSSSPRRSGR